MTGRRGDAFGAGSGDAADSYSEPGARPGVRIGDAERERAVSALGEHFAAGRLTADELDQRLGLAWSAKTAADLSPLFGDLPGAAGIAVVAEREGRPVPVRGRAPGRRIGFALPVLPIVVLLVILTIVTHVPFVLFFLGWWFFIGRFFSRGPGWGRANAFRQPYALRR